MPGPPEVSAALPTFGYGIGTGPAGDGVLHTSGKTVLSPPLVWWTTPRPFTKTVHGMTAPPPRECGCARSSARACRSGAPRARSATCRCSSGSNQDRLQLAPAALRDCRRRRPRRAAASPGTTDRSGPRRLTPSSAIGSPPRSPSSNVRPALAALREARIEVARQERRAARRPRFVVGPGVDRAAAASDGATNPKPAGGGRSPSARQGRCGSSRLGSLTPAPQRRRRTGAKADADRVALLGGDAVRAGRPLRGRRRPDRARRTRAHRPAACSRTAPARVAPPTTPRQVRSPTTRTHLAPAGDADRARASPSPPARAARAPIRPARHRCRPCRREVGGVLQARRAGLAPVDVGGVRRRLCRGRARAPARA